MAKPLVIATGHTWPDLAIEQAVLSKRGIELRDGRGLAPDDPAWSEAAGVLLGTGTKLDAARLSAMTQCVGIARYGIGYDNVDIDKADELGIAVAIVRDYCVDEVAEHAVACALSLVRQLPHWDATARAGAWRGSGKPTIHKLSVLSFGVIGFGLIGRRAAEKAKGLFGTVMIHDPVVTPTAADRAAGYRFVDDLADLLAEADVVSVHVPLSPGTRDLLDGKALARMKPTAYVINVSRGGIVNEAALLEAIRSGRLAGAALDTFVKEPIAADNPLLAERKILLSPHVAFLSEEAETTLRQSASEEIVLLLAGTLPAATVTKRNTRVRA